MKIITELGEVPFKLFDFPDGQPHFALNLKETRAEALIATIESRIANPHELFQVLLAKDSLTASGYRVSLDIRYLMGARMDKRINHLQPFTLQIVANALMNAGFTKIRILDPHSSMACKLLGAEAIRPTKAIEYVLLNYNESNTRIIIPDKGAADRPLPGNGYFLPVYCGKVRDVNTGQLTSFEILNGYPVDRMHCLIIDDICDGGGTFVGLSKLLRANGALTVDLFVTHGIFSRGLPLNGINTVYTTDSYQDAVNGAVTIPFRF